MAEMVDRLREHTSLLREYLERVMNDGDRRYLGEIAVKVRLLAMDGKSNKALMLRVGELIDATPMAGTDTGERFPTRRCW
jgi:hypothetical protein